VRNFRPVLVVLVCLGITGSRVGWADPAHADWVDDPLAPHVTRGTTARLGTAVGFVYGEPLDILAIGVTAAVGQRFDRLAIEAELAYLALQIKGGDNPQVGNAERLGVVARYDVLRIGPRWVGGNSLLSLYVEGGAAVAWNHWSPLAANEATREVPQDTKRVEGQAGFGLSLDHRLQQPIGFPHRVGWFLGWRFALSPVGSASEVTCRGTICERTLMMPEDHTSARLVERSMVFQSSLSMTW
jgi:hypothetical protein